MATPTPEQILAVRATLVEVLRPLIDPSNTYYDADEDGTGGDTFGPGEFVREAVKGALADLKLDGLGGCKLCAS